MLRTLEAVLEADGNVRLLESVELSSARRVLVTILNDEAQPERRLAEKSRWARAAEYFASDEAGHLDGKSDLVKEYVRDFREGFQL
jgi:hypothetical protein